MELKKQLERAILVLILEFKKHICNLKNSKDGQLHGPNEQNMLCKVFTFKHHFGHFYSVVFLFNFVNRLILQNKLEKEQSK